MKPKQGSYDSLHLPASAQRRRLKLELISFVDVGHTHTLKASPQPQGFKPVTAPARLTSRMQFQIKIGLKLHLVRIAV